jgi:hypothetical protein
LSPTAELLDLTGDQQTLVEIVVQDTACNALVFLAERDGDGVHDRVTNRVGMAKPLAFYDFIALTRKGGGERLLTNNTHS